MERTAIQIDVLTVRLIGDGDYRGSEIAKEFRRDFRSRAVRAIYNDLQIGQRQASTDLMPQVVEVAIAQVNRILLVGRTSSFARFGHAEFALGNVRFNLSLSCIIKFSSTRIENLNAIICKRIVRRADHDTRI